MRLGDADVQAAVNIDGQADGNLDVVGGEVVEGESCHCILDVLYHGVYYGAAAGNDTDEEYHGNTVADALFVDSLTQEHDKHGACGEACVPDLAHATYRSVGNTT